MKQLLSEQNLSLEVLKAIEQKKYRNQCLLGQKMEESQESHDRDNIQNNEITEETPIIPNQNSVLSKENEAEEIKPQTKNLITNIGQNKSRIKTLTPSIINPETTADTPTTKKKGSTGRKKKGSNETGIHTWKDPGNIRTKCVTTFTELCFSHFKKLCQKYGFKLKKPDSGKAFGKNKKAQKKFFSVKIYQIWCLKKGNKEIMIEMVKIDDKFYYMANCKVEDLYKNVYINNNSTISLDENDISNYFKNLSLDKGLELKRNKMIAGNYNSEKREEIINSLEKYSKSLIKDLENEENYKSRKGKEPTIVYEVVPEIENKIIK